MKFEGNIARKCAFVILAMLYGCSGNTESGSNNQPSNQNREKAPAQIKEIEPVIAADFELSRLEGGTFRLSDYRGQIILLDFWATWCRPCRMTIPHLIKLYQQYKDKNVLVVGISLDGGDPATVSKFVDEFKIPYPILLGDAETVAKYGNFPAIPVSFLIDQKGEIVERHSGFRPRQIYETAIDLLLAGPDESEG